MLMLLLVAVLAESWTRLTACLESALIYQHSSPLLQGAEIDHHFSKQAEPEETVGPQEPAIHTDLLWIVTLFHSPALQDALRGVFMTKHVTSCDYE